LEVRGVAFALIVPDMSHPVRQKDCFIVCFIWL